MKMSDLKVSLTVDPLQLRLTPNAGHVMGYLKRAGLKIVIVTNQSCVDYST
jgi:histidinol phosphatase-like enzyme